jgi:3-phenylpropionate/trans-cinnamate dioxygenase ferredoxin reductase component
MNLHVKYLLVGAGVAASNAAQEIRKLDPRGDLLLIGQEINRPYHRPPLSKNYLLGPRLHEDLFTLPADWFNAHHVQLRTGTRVGHLDPGRHSAILEHGEEISFDRLLIATGGSPRALHVPGANLPNLFYLRTLADAEGLIHAIDKAKREGRPHPGGRGRVVVIGGGLLGLELAGTFKQAGLHVDLAVSRNYPWERHAGETTGRCLTRFLEQNQVNVHLQNPVIRVEGDGRVQRVVLATQETVDCDFAVAAVGLDVHKEFLRGTPIAAEKAILVDSQCRTSVPDIYAAGDCAAVFDPLFGKHRLLSHWDSATETGKIAGINMAGGNASYNAVSHFRSSMLGLNIDVWGEAKLVDRRIVRGVASAGVETPNFIEIGVAADGRIAQVICVGGCDERDALIRLVANRAQVNGNEERLKDPAISLNQLIAE